MSSNIARACQRALSVGATHAPAVVPVRSYTTKRRSLHQNEEDDTELRPFNPVRAIRILGVVSITWYFFYLTATMPPKRDPKLEGAPVLRRPGPQH